MEGAQAQGEKDVGVKGTKEAGQVLPAPDATERVSFLC